MQPGTDATRGTVVTAAQSRGVSAEWGELTWFANAELGDVAQLTVGRCVLRPGHENPRHRHPNCDEVLVVLSGRVLHTIASGEDVELGPGDTIVLPAGLPHRARNLGEVDAVLMLAYTSGRRETVGE